MKTLLLTFLLTPLLYFSQITNEWLLAGTTSDGSEHYVKNIRKESSDSYTFWVKAVYPPEKVKNKKGVTVTKPGSYDMQFWTAYCGANQYSISEVTKYNSKGIVIKSYDFSYYGAKNAVPDSIAETIILYVCNSENQIED